MKAKIIVNKKRPELRLFQNPTFVLFVVGSLLVAVIEATNGEWLTTIWVVLALSLNVLLEICKGYIEDYEELVESMMDDVIQLEKEMDQRDNEIAALNAALQAEISKRKND